MEWLKYLFIRNRFKKFALPEGIDPKQISSPVWEFLETYTQNPKRFQLTVRTVERSADKHLRVFTFKDKLTKESWECEQLQMTGFHYLGSRLPSYKVILPWATRIEQGVLRVVISSYYDSKRKRVQSLVPRKRRLEQERVQLQIKQERERLTSIYGQ